MSNQTVSSSTTQSTKSASVTTQPNFKIKRASWADMKHVAGFIRSSADWYRKFVDPKDMSEHEVGDKWIAENFFRREFYVGFEDDTPIGSISMQNLNGFTYLGYIYLDTNFVGNGYGHKLMDFARNKSMAQNRKGMVLIAHPEAKWAVKAYEKYGFKRLSNKRQDILAWQNGALKTYYEEGFDLYQYPF